MNLESDSLSLKKTENKTFVESEEGETYYRVRKMNLVDAFDMYWIPILIVSIINISIITIFSLFFSHRMAGPLYRIRKTLTEYLEHKNPLPIRLRNGDHFEDIADLINRSLHLKHAADENLNKTAALKD